MKPDIALIRHTLGILRRIGDCGLEDAALKIEIEVAASRSLTNAEATDAINFCADRGWVFRRSDTFGQDIVVITRAGVNQSFAK